MSRHLLTLAGPALAALLLSTPAEAQQRQRGPQRLGEHGAWTAATAAESGQKVCYAFARAARAAGGRGTVTLTVSHRPNGRDQVALSVGHALQRTAQSLLTVGSAEFRSYAVVQSSAFFQGSAELINAFRRGRDAVARSPAASGGGTVNDTFSLSGFTAAYEAISRECPAR